MKALAPRHASHAASHLPERTRVALAAIRRATRSIASDTDLAKIGIARHEILVR